MKQEIAPVALWQDPQGNWIYDFGVNVAAIPLLTVEQPAGTRIKMRMGETLAADKSIEYNTTGVAATGVVQTDEYVCTGKGKEKWTPRFTYHGFRYLELSGAATQPEKDVAESGGRTHRRRTESVRFECADPQINRLHETGRPDDVEQHSRPADRLSRTANAAAGSATPMPCSAVRKL